MIVPPTSPTQAGDPLRMNSVQTPGGGRIGLVHCPGRSRTDASGRMTMRDLDEDLAAIEAWGASVLVSLVEAAEFERLGAGELPATVKQRSFAWLHAPIPDMQAPPVDAVATLTHHAPELIAALQRGERIVIHCAAGLGRSGSIAAWLLVEMGAEPQGPSTMSGALGPARSRRRLRSASSTSAAASPNRPTWAVATVQSCQIRRNSARSRPGRHA